MIGEVAHLPVRAVAELVGVFAMRKLHRLAAEPDALAIVVRLDAPGLLPAVTRGADEHEPHRDRAAVLRRVDSGEVAEDAAADALALGVDADDFPHFERAI